MNVKCCLGCTKRLTGDQDCHKNCEEYKKAKQKIDERREKIRNAKYLDSLHSWNRN